MKISVIIPLYNAEKYIARCLDSILNQKVDVEIIVIDNNSTDNSYSICEKHAKEYSCIKLIRYKEKQGTSPTRNIGLKYVTGDIISFCDNDDWFEINTFSKVLERFKYNNIDMVAVGINNHCESHSECIIYDGNDIMTFDQMIDECYSAKNSKISCGVTEKFFKKELLDGYEFNEKLSHAEDFVFLLKVLSEHKHLRCFVIKEALFNYSNLPTSISLNSKKMFDTNDVLIYHKCFNTALSENNLSKRQILEIRYRILIYAIDAIRSYNPNRQQKNNLVKEIKNNFITLFIFAFKYGFISNLKMFLLSLLYIVC